MLHLRIICPTALIDRVGRFLTDEPAATNVIVLRGAALDPPGDVVFVDVAREAASYVLESLKGMDDGRGAACAIAIEEVDTALSKGAEAAERAAPGLPSDAVVWEQVESRTSEEATLSVGFVLFLLLATLIAAVGILTNSPILIVGAMVVGPEFGPLAGISVALVQRRLDLACRSLLALAVGFPIAIAAAYALVATLRALDRIPASYRRGPGSEVFFIAHPDVFSVLVALIAGIAGMLSLTTAKSSALVGVLISVTTVPAAANIGVAAATGRWNELVGACLQLGINLASILVAGTATLLVQRLLWRHGRRPQLREQHGRQPARTP